MSLKHNSLYGPTDITVYKAEVVKATDVLRSASRVQAAAGPLYGHTAFGFDKAEQEVPAELARSPRTETDPNGKSLNEPGAKGDAGKVRPALVLGGFARALLAVAEVGTYGAKKYSDAGWLEVPNGVVRYDEAMMRHWLKEKTGEQLDPETGLLHLSHACWNMLAKLDLVLREKEAKSEQ